ncbi:lachrymatory-factor synthase-like [Phragmites australis]|uniref:lachrymatory-factor synthase-like n=1 Tax=Phragmites australis TaxID=29695 RepID=UPI002D7699AC|nr:lachrymatory-factor synthase-like [Phragmites australis]
MASAESTQVSVVVGGVAAAAPRSKAWEWEGCVVSAVQAATADEAWALLSDFLAFHRWHPRVAACRLASGTPRAPGCVRYCEGTPDGDGAPPDWAHETLLEHDPGRRFFRYEMNDNNMGFGRFFATFRVVPDDAAGCELRWEFECEPVRGTPREALAARLQAGLDGMAARVRDYVLAARAGAVVAGGLEAADELKLGNSIAV